MNKEIVIIRFGELFLKGNNRAFFESLLLKNIRTALKDLGGEVIKARGRYTVEDFPADKRPEIMAALKKVFGIHSLSFAAQTTADMDSIYQLCRPLCKAGSFKVQTNRADKSFPLTSMQVSAQIGGRLLREMDGLTVDVHSPDTTIYIDIREDGRVFVYAGIEEGAGGMPVGSSAKGMLLLSGGIDSPVAGYLMARRGMNVCAVHYHSHPYTSEHARQKVITLAQKLSPYLNGVKLFIVPFTDIQQSIHKHCREDYMITIMRRFMMRIACELAKKEGAGALINGESLGQVASQTLESITVTGAVSDIPVFRPLIGMDKLDIIKIAQKIDTYPTSILPYEDCCTIFLPKNPVIKPKLSHAETQEQAIPDMEELIVAAVNGTEVLKI